MKSNRKYPCKKYDASTNTGGRGVEMLIGAPNLRIPEMESQTLTSCAKWKCAGEGDKQIDAEASGGVMS